MRHGPRDFFAVLVIEANCIFDIKIIGFDFWNLEDDDRTRLKVSQGLFFYCLAFFFRGFRS